MPIVRLAGRPDLAAETAHLMESIWPGHYGPGGEGDAAADVESRIAQDRAAITVHNSVVVGTVALDKTSFGSQGDGPWMVGLCTAPDVRGQGIATALTVWAMGMARKRGEKVLFATTREAAGIVQRLGWRKVRHISDQSGTWSIWKIALTDR